MSTVKDDGPNNNITDNQPSSTNIKSEEENEEKLKGIDIKAAMSILSSRQPHSHDHSHEHGGCSAGKDDDIKRTMGQTINLLSEYDEENNNEAKQDDNEKVSAKDNVKNTSQTEKDEEAKQQQKEREKEIRAKFESMSLYKLLQSIMEIQKERVQAYQTYDSGLSTVLSTGNVTTYPVICANATATFSVLSNTVRTIKSILEEKHCKRKDLIKLVTKLQTKECEKLNLTAALHLEKMRERDHSIAMEMNSMQQNSDKAQNDDGNKKAGGEERIGELLRQGVSSLNIKLSKCIEDINEILEEFRYALMDEQEDED